jgi:hypothetical protein
VTDGLIDGRKLEDLLGAWIEPMLPAASSEARLDVASLSESWDSNDDPVEAVTFVCQAALATFQGDLMFIIREQWPVIAGVVGQPFARVADGVLVVGFEVEAGVEELGRVTLTEVLL